MDAQLTEARKEKSSIHTQAQTRERKECVPVFSSANFTSFFSSMLFWSLFCSRFNFRHFSSEGTLSHLEKITF